MKKGSETQSVPRHFRVTTQRAVFPPEKRRRTGRESWFPLSSASSLKPRRRSGLQQSRILLLELLQVLGGQKALGIGNGQNLSFQNRESAIPGALFPAEGLGKRQEHSHLRHLFNSVHEHGNGST